MKIGILKTGFSVGGIFLGWLFAGQFSPHLGEIISQSIRNDTIITVISYALIIIATMMVFNYSYKIVKPVLSIATLGFSNLIDKIGGIILLFTGIAIITGQLQVLGFFILEYFPFLGKIG